MDPQGQILKNGPFYPPPSTLLNSLAPQVLLNISTKLFQLKHKFFDFLHVVFFVLVNFSVVNLVDVSEYLLVLFDEWYHRPVTCEGPYETDVSRSHITCKEWTSTNCAIKIART